MIIVLNKLMRMGLVYASVSKVIMIIMKTIYAINVQHFGIFIKEKIKFILLIKIL